MRITMECNIARSVEFNIYIKPWNWILLHETLISKFRPIPFSWHYNKASHVSRYSFDRNVFTCKKQCAKLFFYPNYVACLSYDSKWNILIFFFISRGAAKCNVMNLLGHLQGLSNHILAYHFFLIFLELCTWSSSYKNQKRNVIFSTLIWLQGWK